MAAISRENLDVKALRKYQVCSRHFVTGKPTALKDDANVDWLPKINLGHSKGVRQASAEQAVAKVMRYERARRRRDMKQAREQKEIEALYQIKLLLQRKVKEEIASVLSKVTLKLRKLHIILHINLLRKQLCQSPRKLDMNRWN